MSGKKFECLRCGECCRWEGYVHVSAREREKIAAFLEVPVAKFVDEYCRPTTTRRSLSLIEKEDGSCIFLRDDTNECVINPVKPRQCMGFPGNWSFSGYEKYCRGRMVQRSATILLKGDRHG